MSALSTIEISEDPEGFLFSETGFLKFTPDGQNLLAVCNDGAIYKYTYNQSDGLANLSELAILSLPLSERIAMISVSNACSLAFASEEHEAVKLCQIEGGKFGEAKLVTKCAGKVLAVAINSQGTMLCCSGADNVTKIINVKDQEFPVLGQIPSSHFVRSIAFSEDGRQLAFLQVDGMLRLFKVVENNPAPQLIQTLPGIKGNLNGKFQVTWKGEDHLSVIYGSKTLRIYQMISGKWEIKSEFTNVSDILGSEFISKELSLISFADETISLFSTTRNKILTSTKSKWERLDKSSLAAVNESFACIFEPSKGDLFKIKINFDTKDLIVPVDHKEKRKSKLSKLNSKRVKSKFISNEANGSDADSGDEGHEHEHAESGNESDNLRSNSNGDADDIDVDMSTRSNGCEIENLESGDSKHSVVQPCCTEWRNLQRYLAYNNHGYITARSNLDNEDVFNYDIEFMDRSANNPIRFEDKVAYNLASMGVKGAAFASSGAGACLHFVSFKTSDDSWTIPLALGSEPILNDRGIMNVYTLTGLLRSTVMCPGRPISLVCNEEEVFLLTEDYEGILCNRLNPKNGGVLAGSQSSRVLLYCPKEDGNEIVWCGLSFSGVLGSFTSMGKFLIYLNRDGCDRWTEIASYPSDNIWPIYFDVNTLSGVACKEDEKYPDPYPSPHIIDFNFKLPELQNDPSYEEVFRTNLILNETKTNSDGLTDREKKKMFASSDRNLLELAQLSIKTNRLSRLSDLANWATTEKTVELLIQLAKHHKLNSIVEEIETIRANMFRKSVNSAASTASPSVNTFINPDVTMVSMSPAGNSNSWITPKLPEMVAKESPSGILANLTPMKPAVSTANEPAAPSSPAELPATPSNTSNNPFAKPAAAAANENQTGPNSEGNAMLDYINAMMKLNGGNNKKKPTSNLSKPQ